MKQLHVNIPADLMAQIRDAAEREHETLSVWARRVLREASDIPSLPRGMLAAEFSARKAYADEHAADQLDWWRLFGSPEAYDAQ